MKPKQLQWKIQDFSPKVWIAQIKEYGTIQFEIHQVTENKYLLKSNLVNIKRLLIEELDFAKELAQKQFDVHVQSLLDYNT